MRLRFDTSDSDEARMMIRSSFNWCALKDDEKKHEHSARNETAEETVQIQSDRKKADAAIALTADTAARTT